MEPPYWKSVRTEAWKQALADCQLDSSVRVVTKVGAAILALALLWSVQPLQGVDRLRLQIIATVALAGVLPLVWLWRCLRVAADRDKAKSQTIEEQKLLLSSLSPLEFTEKPTDQRNVAWIEDEGPYGHVVLHNRWTDKSAPKVEVHLARVTQLDDNGEPMRSRFVLDGLPVGLVTRDREKQKDIPPDDEEAFVLCEAHWTTSPDDPEQMEQQVTQIAVAPWRASGKAILLPAGRYRFEVVAKGLDIRPQRQTYLLNSSSTSFAFKMETPSTGQL